MPVVNTAQEMFDKVSKHLLKQNAQALRGGQCVYLAPDGKKCGIGCLIPSDMYFPGLEGFAASHLFSDERLFPKSLYVLANALQTIHDTFEPEHWLEQLRKTAVTHNLRFQE